MGEWQGYKKLVGFSENRWNLSGTNLKTIKFII
jgi:hypothetical protein